MLLYKQPSVNKILAVLAYLVAAFAGALGQFCFKIFSLQMAEQSNFALSLNPHLWVAILCYVSVMVLFIVGLKLWGEMSTLYPVYGTTFVWALVMSAVWLEEEISKTSIAGTSLIILGIGLLYVKPFNKTEKLS